MLATLATIFMGWPAIIGTSILCSAGLISKQPALLVLGALLMVPFAWYLSMSPLFQTIGLCLPLLCLALRMSSVVAADALLSCSCSHLPVSCCGSQLQC